MGQEKRRSEIVKLLQAAEKPITGAELSARFGVTRQIIVGDVAVLRARGEEIIATPRGYILFKSSGEAPLRRTFAVRHSGERTEIAAELFLIVRLGGTVVDVTVEHPVYGELRGNLQIMTEHDVEQFLRSLTEHKAEPLLVLTGGYHLHTVEAADTETMEQIHAGLRQAGYLAE
ncbi:MAG: transcription repressor NadR [Limnochordia bacterium]